MDKTQKRQERLLKLAETGGTDKDLEIFDAITELEDKVDAKFEETKKLVETLAEKDALAGVDMVKIKGPKGDKGDTGEPGKDGINGRDGRDGMDGKIIKGINGKDGRDGKDGTNGRDGRDGKDGKNAELPDLKTLAVNTVNYLETLEGEDRLDAKAIKNLPEATKEVIRMSGGGNVEVFYNGNKINSSQKINITGSAVISNEGGATKIAIKKRVVNVTQSATPAINTDITDVAYITGLAQAVASFSTNLTGSPINGDTLIIDITDNGTGRALTFGSSFEASGTIALPTTTVASTKLTMGFRWNVATSKWTIVGIS